MGGFNALLSDARGRLRPIGRRPSCRPFGQGTDVPGTDVHGCGLRLTGIVNVGGTTVGVGTTTCVGFAACYAGTSSRTAFGWTAGGGAEYGLSRNWTIRAEYLYVDLGSNNFAANIVAPGAVDSFTARFNPTTFNVVRGGFNFRF